MMKNFHNFTNINNIKVLQFEHESINTELEEGEGNVDWMVFNKKIISKFLKIVLNKNNFNLLVIDKTNCLAGLLRKVCKWNYSSLISEYRLYAGKNSTYFSETFLELATIQLKTHSNNIHIMTGQNQFRTSRHGSIDRTVMEQSEEDQQVNKENHNTDEFDEDEDLLSGSPQVPRNLIKMVEMRKKKNNRERQVMESLNTLEYKFYVPETVFRDVEVIKVELPKESYLPDWFVWQRKCWEEEFLELNLGNY